MSDESNLSESAINSLVRSKLSSERVKLWLPPYSDEDGSRAAFTEELTLRYSQELHLSFEVINTAVEELRVSSLERLAARTNYQLTNTAALKIKVTFPNGEKKKLILNTKLNVKGCELRQQVRETCKADRVKLISAGKLVADESTLEEQNITVNSVIMAMVLSEPVESVDKLSSEDALLTTRNDAEILSNQSDNDGMESLMQIADQNGRSINIPKEEKKALAVAMVLNEKGKTALRRKNYSGALLFLLEADKEFKKCSADILLLVDNYALLCLDIAWCYLCLQSMEDLPDAEIRLKSCEECLSKSYGTNMERLRAVKGATGSESALFVRLHLLQGIVAFHRRQLKLAEQLFKNVENEMNGLIIDDETLSQVMALGFTAKEARLGLRNSKGDLEMAVSYIISKKKDKAELQQKEKEERIKKAAARALGKAANGEWLNVDFYNNLISMGYLPVTAKEALKQSANNISLAVQIIQDNPALLQIAENNSSAVVDETLAQVVSCGFEPMAARACLSKNSGNVQATIDELLASGGLFLDVISPNGASSSNKQNTSKLEDEALERLQADIDNDDEDAYLDLTLEEECAFLQEYKLLMKHACITE